MGKHDYQQIDLTVARAVILVPIVWVLLWIYQEAKVLDNTFFLAQAASFIFIILLPIMYVFHRHAVKQIYARHIAKETKQHIARHRVILYLLSLIVPFIVFVAYWDLIFNQSLEQNLVYGLMLVLVTASIQLTTINLLSLMMRAKSKHDPLPNVLATLVAYPLVAVPVFQSFVYFVLIGA